MKVVHIASHKGNVGDIVNHMGFYTSIISEYNVNRIDQMEMRDFYYNARKRKKFDAHCADLLNEYDLVVIGGGGFFDVQWEQSSTGTTLDFSDEFIDAITTKVLVNAMGYHEYPEATSEVACGKFARFIEKIGKKENWLITVRNDGSYHRFLSRYSDAMTKYINVVPDNGFYCKFGNLICKKADKTIGMCITNDLFSERYNQNVNRDSFNIYMVSIINELCGLGYRIVFLPHTPADMDVIYKIYNKIDGVNRRNKIVIGALDCNGEFAIEHLSSNYKQCDCIVGMRFHSLIMGLDCRIPTIAIAGHEQIEGLFAELGLNQYLIKLDNLNFREKLITLIGDSIAQTEEIIKQYEKIFIQISSQREAYRKIIAKFINL